MSPKYINDVTNTVHHTVTIRILKPLLDDMTCFRASLEFPHLTTAFGKSTDLQSERKKYETLPC